MKKFLTPVKVILLCLPLAAVAFAAYQYYSKDAGPVFLGKSEEVEEEYDDPVGRAAYEFNMLKNPVTGQIPEGAFEEEMMQARDIYARQIAAKEQAINTYLFQGPGNLGGRTRAVVYDVRFNGTSNQTIMAGGVSGGIYKSTDNGSSWTRKSPTNQLYSVTSIAQDPRAGQENTWYYATGEHTGNSASQSGAAYYGNGIYKSTDNGETWTRLANSNTSAWETTFNDRRDIITKVAVNPTNGDVYMAAIDAIYRSTDGGANWAPTINSGGGANSSMVTDVAITSTGRIYVAFAGNNTAAPTNAPGVWTSTTGAAGSWTKIAGETAATNHANWDLNGTYFRIVLAIAPSNENIVYALYDDGDLAPQIEAEFFKWDNSLGTWTDLSANLPNELISGVNFDPFQVQLGYDMVVAVKPDDPNTVFIGGTNIYRSTDGFTTTANYKRIGGYAAPGSSGLYANSHPDIHAIAFQPGTPTTMICGNDGGIQRTTDNLASTVSWTHLANGYRTYQYYYVALDPTNASAKVFGGAQDNGSTRNIGNTGSNFEQVLPGDGVSVGLSRRISGVQWEYGGSQYGYLYRRPESFSPNTGFSMRPTAATANGLFVTLFHLDPDNTDTLYYANTQRLWRTTTASSTTTTVGWTELTGISTAVTAGIFISSMATTRGAYNPATASLFVGTSNGKLFRLDNPAAAAAATAPVDITGASFSGYVSSISVNPRNDDTVLVTFSNYGVLNVFWTGNANSASPTWLEVEGPVLKTPSYRSSAIAITNNGVEYFVGTSVGLYKASITAATAATTNWVQEGATDLGFVPVVHLFLRTVDNRLLVGTHGIGMWATTLTGAGLPVKFTSFTGKAEDKQNVLQWEVENEVDNKGYEIERKYKTESGYTKIGFVPAKNANANANTYTFPDKLVDLGIDNVSYRLKQIDIDGKATYSNTVTLTRKVSAKFVEYISVRPGNLFIRMNGQGNHQVTFRLFDNTGRLVQQKQLQQRTQDVSLASLPRGVFVVELSAPDGQKFTQRIVN